MRRQVDSPEICQYGLLKVHAWRAFMYAPALIYLMKLFPCQTLLSLVCFRALEVQTSWFHRVFEKAAGTSKMATKWDIRDGPNGKQPTASRCVLPL